MFIQTEETPNPAVMKFITGEVVLPESFEGENAFDTAAQASQSPLAQMIFKIDGIDGVFLGEDFIAVARKENKSWDVLRPLVLEALMDHAASGLPIVDENAAVVSLEEGGDVETKIKKILDEKIRPMVAQDGGDIAFDHFEDGVAYVQLRGACSGCPSATITLKAVVEKLLTQMIPEVTEVRAVRPQQTSCC